MFALLFDRQRRILLARVSGTFSTRTIRELDAAGASFVAREGVVETVIDFSDVEEVLVPTASMVARGMRPPVMADKERIYVMPRDDLYGLGRMLASYQRLGGNRAPLIVRTMDDAYARLGPIGPDFEVIRVAS